MLKYIKHRYSLLLLVLLSAGVNALDYVPEVYQDDYIIVRSGIDEAGRKPVHLGDRLSLVIEAEFPANEVIIENLDEQLFERSWGSEKGVGLIDRPEVTRIDGEDGQTIIRGSFPFQILDCPGDLTSCRGNKHYELPVFSLGYQILDGAGSVVNNKSVRFNPVPGHISVMQSLDIQGEGGLDKLSAYLGNSGYPAAMSIPQVDGAGSMALITGGILFLLSFFPVLFSRETGRPIESTRKARHRWEKVLHSLEDRDGSLSDDEWSDLLRRAVTWYAMDELGINPYNWLLDIQHLNESPQQSDLREYFIDVLNQEGIPAEDRQEYLQKFLSLSSASPVTGVAA